MVTRSVFLSLAQGPPSVEAGERGADSSHRQCHQADAPPYDGGHAGEHPGSSGRASHPQRSAALMLVCWWLSWCEGTIV